MFSHWKQLQRSYREVNALFADLKPPVFARQDWDGTVYARRSLGNDVQVEVWYLAEHFLLAWHDWSEMCGRYLEYFGQPVEKLPRTWNNLTRVSKDLAQRIIRNEALDEIVSGAWIAPTVASGMLGKEDRSAGEFFHDVVSSHRRLSLLSAMQARLDAVGAKMADIVGPQNRAWPQSMEIAQDLNGRMLERWEHLASDEREETLFYLHNYQHATLAVSWLTEESVQQLNNRPSAFMQILRSERPVSPSVEQFVRQLNISAEERDTVNRVIRRVESAIGEIGYENFVEDVLSSDFEGGSNSPIGSDAVNLIPGRGKGVYCITLLAVSRGDRKTFGFSSIMKQVREHLIRCMEKTRVVIVLCDHWKPDMLDEHIGDLRAHHARGVQFLFLMVGTPGRGVAPVAVDLGLTP